MLKFLRFSIGGYFGGYDEISLWVHDHSAEYEILFISEALVEETYQAIKDYDLRHGVTAFTKVPPENYGTDAPGIPKTNERFPIKDLERLSEWDTLGVNSWAEEYFECCCDGTQWELVYREDGKKERRTYGSNAYPPNWNQFIEWLDALMPEMRFAKNKVEG